MSILSLANVHKSFDGIPALRGISLEISRGETIAIIGPSGCGKTTLLRCISLLEQIDQGAIYFDDEPVTIVKSNRPPAVHVELDEYRTRVGMVFQHLHVWPHMSVLDNLVLPARVVRRLPKKITKDRAFQLLRKMDIENKARDYPATLSGGQQQRVALARALMMEPQILLLDEITSALDPELVGDVLDIIADLAEGGMTMLIVTHEMLFAMEVADRIVFIDEGRITEKGDPSTVFSSPKTKRLQSFLERINRHRSLGVRK